jgi:hypothetical protein
MSKFRPSEWFAYTKTFYDDKGQSQYKPDKNFDMAWLLHQHRNPHHWQYWLSKDNGENVVCEMPPKYVMEMVSDWAGAGRAITGKWECSEWYEKNKHKIILTDRNIEQVHALFRELKRNIK